MNLSARNQLKVDRRASPRRDNRACPDRYRQRRDRHLVNDERGGRRSRSGLLETTNRRYQGFGCHGSEVIAARLLGHAARSGDRCRRCCCAAGTRVARGEQSARVRRRQPEERARRRRTGNTRLNRQERRRSPTPPVRRWRSRSKAARRPMLFISADQGWMDYAAGARPDRPEHPPRTARQQPGADRAEGHALGAGR